MDSGFPLKRGGCFVVGIREWTCQQAAAETGFSQAVEMSLISLLLLQSNSTVNPRYDVDWHKGFIKYSVVVASRSCVLDPSSRQHLSYDVSGGKRGDYQNCSVFYCVLKLHTIISTHRWAVLTVLWIGFCHTRRISLCVDLFVFVCFVCYCFILHSCRTIVSAVGWTWLDWSLILRTYFRSGLWHCWLGHLTRKN